MNNIKTNVLFFVLMALIFVAFVALFTIQPHDLIPWLLQHYGWSIEKRIILEHYIQQETWLKFKLTLVFVFFFLIYLRLYDERVLKEYKQSFASLFYWLKRDFIAYPIRERIMLGTILLFFTLLLFFYCCITPLQLDELHTWLFFIDKGPLVTATYYPSSNNHIAYNLLSVGWNFFLPPLWAIRIVSMLASIGIVGLFFIILRRRYTIVFSFTGLLLLMSSAPFLWYSVQGRGYILELFFLILMLYMLVQAVSDVATDRLLVICNALAIYVVPIAVFPVFILNAYYAYRLVQEKEQKRIRFIRIFIYSAVLIFFCYAPMIIFSGAKQLFNNPFVERIAYHETLIVGVLKYMPQLWDFVSGSEGLLSIGILTVFVSGSVFLLWKRNTFILWPLALFTIPFLLLQCYPVLLFERTWLWLIIPFVVYLIEMAQFFSNQGRKWISSILLVLCFIISLSNIVRSYKTNQLLVEHADQFMKVKNSIDSRLKGKVLRVYDDVVYDYLLFYQMESENYTLLFGDQHPARKADGVLMDYQNFKPSDGSILWTNQKEVLFQPK